jgi:radical SAM superfamily enzyme YgiQ (UPF0313 family)
MRILLVSPSIEDAHRSTEGGESHYPLGLGYLHAYMEQQGHRVRTLFLNNVDGAASLSAADAALREFQPDLVGIQMITANRVCGYGTIELVRDRMPGLPVVLGGIHASVMYRQILERYPFAIAVLGEGETTLAELAARLQAGESTDDVPGIARHDGASVVVTPPRELIPDLDVLPFPKHELFLDARSTLAALLTSRGCPFACSFCVLEKFSRRKVRYRSVANIVDEVQFLLARFPNLQNIWIHDDAFFLDNKRVIAFCDEVVRRGIRTRFTCSSRFKPISRELVSALESAGFTHVLFGLESGAEKVMKATRKGISKDDVRKAFRLFADSGIMTTSFLIVGLPGETDETVDETIRFVQEIQAINYSYYDDIGVLMVYPGTEVYGIACSAGTISDEFWLTGAPTPYFTAEHDERKLFGMKERIRDHISLGRIVTPAGFLAQRKLIPSIMRYSLRFGNESINQAIGAALNRYGLTREVALDALRGAPGQSARKLAEAVEHILFEAALASIGDEKEKLAFARDYLARVKADAEALPAPDPTAPREAYLFRPDWRGDGWARVVHAFIDAFSPADPVALVLVAPPAGDGQPSVEAAQEALMQAVAASGRDRFPDLVFVDRIDELPEVLAGFPVVRPLRGADERSHDPGGPLGSRFAAALRRK